MSETEVRDGLPGDNPPAAPHAGTVASHGSTMTRTYGGDVAAAASELLIGYRDAGSCVLIEAGYLDLMGKVWGCVIEGDGWVDLCTVRTTSDEACSEVSVVRMEVAEWEADLEDKVAAA